jgi:DNA-binding SARP family transcriptional activator/predicted ATPase
MTPIRIELLGALRITFGHNLLTSVNTNRMRSLLAFLVLKNNAPQSREHLAFLLWPDSDESQARTNLRQLLHRLRHALPAECALLVADNQTVRWRADSSCTIDVIDFEAAIDRAAEAGEKGDAASAREALDEAARLYQDDLLPELYDDWLQAKRESLRAQFAEIVGRLVVILEMSGDYRAAIRHATRLVALDPLREASYQTLMRMHSRNNDRPSVLRVYHQCLRNLQRELGVRPSEASRAFYEQALQSDELPNPPAELPPYLATKPPPLVGRKIEWDRLVRCWHTVTKGQTHFALIQGEPGIGKSRLADELFELCSHDAARSGARARCYFAQGRLAYGPVAEWLRAEPMRLVRGKLSKPQLAELARVLPEILAEMPDIAAPQPFSEAWQRLHFYEALNAAFRVAPKPLLLLIDDLQWCDNDTIEWLHSLFRSGSAGRILLLGTVRPEETGRDHPLASLVREVRGREQLSEFSITPLSPEETAALADQIAARKCDRAFLSGLYQSTKGNPLFIVESVRASLENRASSKITTPPRVQAVIAARLAQLSPPAYELAGLAATIGQPFSFDLLAKATDWDEDSLFRALEELWQRRIIDGQGAGAYDYTHDLLREEAYTELGPIRRKALHRRVARALEELYAPDFEDVSGRLAAHYDAAGMAEQSIRYYRIAASAAKQRFADVEAADLIRRALRLCREFPRTAKRDMEELELLVTLGPSLVTTQGYSMPEVGETYQRGLMLSERCGDRKHAFSLLSGAWVFHIVRGDLEESRRLAQQCLEGASREGVSAQEKAGHFILGSSLLHLGQLAASREHIEQALPSYDSVPHPALALFAGSDVGVFCRAYLAHVLWLLGDAKEAVTKSNEAVALAREVSHPFSLAIALNYAAMLCVFGQDGKLALTHAEEAFSVCRKHGFAYYSAFAEILAGWATARQGDAPAGVLRLRTGLDALKATQAEIRLPFYYGLLAEAARLGGHVGEALAHVSTGFAFLSKNGETWAAAELHRIHGDVLLQSDDSSGAVTSYRRGIESARQTGARLFELRAVARLDELRALPIDRRNVAER